ncbi:sugar-binding protein [Ferruginibacter albus]|uniref:sugar-binding protein n=1 Tax=Ferruginibacter albus TaxID=2875540 RepID=UPI001CC46381|nr:sugar-binding protein [Ferruginibacter albus]UAY51211.1 gliding motility-associated C-terminal domain-containing protein [Ferruginibacter albus]
MKKTTLRLSAFKFFVLCFTVLISGIAVAQNTFTATNGNWNSAANWSAGHVPNGTENLVIPSGNTCTMDVSYSNTNTFSFAIGGTLNVPSGMTLNCTKATILLNAANATISGGGTVYLYTFTVSTPNATDVVNITNSTQAAQVTFGNSGTNTAATINLTQGLLKLTNQVISFSKTITINATGGDFAHAGDGAGDADVDGGTIVCAGGPATTTVNGAVTFNNITTATGGNMQLTLSTNNGVNTKVNGVFAVTGASANQFKASGNPIIWGPQSTLFLYGNNQWNQANFLSTLWVGMAGGSGTIGVTPGYPNNVTLCGLGTSAGNNYGWVATGDRSLNGILSIGDTLSSINAQVNFSGITNFWCGGFVLTGNSRFSAPSSGMLVKGSWKDYQATGTNLGFVSNNCTVTFGGAGTCANPDSIITKNIPAGETFYNLSVAASAFVKLFTPVTVTNNLTLSQGIFSTSTTNILFVSNSTTSAISGGSSSSYIDGPVKWNSIAGTAATYVFPVGNSAACTPAYLPLTLNLSAVGVTTAMTVQAFNTSSNGTFDGTLSALGNQYWSLGVSAPIQGSTVSLQTPNAVTPYTLISESNTTVNGVYTSIGGTASGNQITNSNDIGSGTSLFFTLGQPPIISTLPPTSVTTTGATFQGGYNTQGSQVQTGFNWGTSTSYGSSVVTIHSPINSTSSTADSAVVTGLTPNTVYHYMATAGSGTGGDITFVTAPNPPTATAASNISGSGFTANWTAPANQGNAPFTYTIQISTDPTFATGVTTQTGLTSTSYAASGLISATTYYYRVQAVNATAASAWSATITATTNLVPTPPCTNNTSSDGATTFTTAPPVIDGTIDQVWSSAPANALTSVVLGTNNNTQNWRSLWTTDSLYLLVEVTDASLISQPSGLGGVPVAGATMGTSANYYEVDGIEFYLDPNDNPQHAYDQVNDIQLRFNLGATSLSGQSYGGPNQFQGAAFNRVAPLVDWKMVVTPTGYLLEAAIPWGKDAAHPGVFLLPTPPNPADTYGTPASGQVIGIDVGVNDQDNASGGRQAQVQWNGQSTGSYLYSDQFKSVGLQICPEPPIVTTPTKDSITATSAKLGATVVSAGKVNGSPSTIIARGTAYATSQPVLSNAGAEGGTSLGAYASVRTGLSPQTKYYYVGYANNAGNLTGVSVADSFYTLSQLPTVQPTLSAATCSGVTLNWTTIQFPAPNEASQTGYIILRRQDGNNPTTSGIKTRVATKQGDLPSGTTLVATVSSGATLTYVDATAQANTTYNYLLVPFTWDGVATDSTYNYFVTNAPTVTATPGATTTPTFNITPLSFCSGATAPTLPLTSTNNPAITGTWSPAVVSNTTGGTYTFTPNQGQCASTTSITITVNNSTTPTFSITPTTICSGDNAPTLPLSSTNNPAITGTWSPAVVSNTNNGVYTFTPDQGQCASTAQVNITVAGKPSVTVNADKTTIAQGDIVTLTGTSNVQGSYLWTSAPDAGFSTTTAASTTSRPNVTTLYTLTVTNGNCTGSDTVTVTVQNLSPCVINVPKAFSPNGDGNNDVWKLSSDCEVKLIVSVYNRWGGLIYHSDGYNNDWNGTYKGNNVADGTYYYVVRGLFPNGSVHTLTGNVTILR